ncbi:aromatic ring-opening dioxygenase LigA [Nocardioides sp. Root122]|uniref:MOSC domain-containing protein n=1 Tax=Nocardioides TaxID=1839 RepID=UPI00070389A2|nr:MULTISPECIES: MOSC N-terminal beta barrel domain-containing protein [Nocardioides]KQV77915.1 aromatic ring-opening dioxygenase LigA [Nocardioides sp. Root122]MCK9822400.1 MOSC domain-containing protein [Nocardioides cavernae]
MSELVVRAAGFSPVKGVRHLALPSVELDALGALGDRSWCLVDVAARRVLRTVQHPSLVSVVARAEGDELSLTLPSGEPVVAPAPPTGETITCDYWGRAVSLALVDGPHASLASDFLGRDVRLAAAPRGGVVFAAPVTIVGTASLDAVDAEAARFRATLVAETDAPWAEDSWLGTTFRVGDAELRIGGPVPRCAVIDHHPETGVKDVRLLKELVRSRPTNAAGEPMFGVYAEVVRPGTVGPRA